MLRINRPSVVELECFVCVAELLSFSRAAKRLHLSQPPLSRHVQSLEKKLGVRLLERSTRIVSLTVAGTLYLEDARQILTRLDGAAEAVCRAARTGEYARLRLAFVGALLDEELVQVLQSFRARHPRCQIHLTDLPPAQQLEALRTGHVDGAFIGAVPRRPGKGIATFVWKREPLLVALPDQHPLAKHRSLTFSQLRAEGWVMVSREAAPAFRQQFAALCAQADFRPRVVQESDRVAAVLTMVAAGQGISLLPAAITRLIEKGVVFRAIGGKKAVLGHAFARKCGAGSDELSDLENLLKTRLATAAG